ncbi:MAG: DUF429 domain-containing protein [bacterium]
MVRKTQSRSTIGVDGCVGGWLASFFENQKIVGFKIYRSFEELWKCNSKASLVLVDIPIGLKDSGAERECDTLARSLLGSRASCVFRVPCRSAVYASSYREALKLNRRMMACGFSKQTWNIVPRIREVDLLLRSDKIAKRVVRESHPELCFRFLSNSKLFFSKRTVEGIEERVKILEKFISIRNLIRSFPNGVLRREADLSDLLDSLVLGVVASMAKDGLSALPEKPVYDRFGLAIQMVVPKGYPER